MSRTSAARSRRLWFALPLLALTFAITLISARGPAAATDDELTPTKEQGEITQHVVAQLELAHITKFDLDNELSAEVLDRYIDFLDPSRTHFVEADLAQFRLWKHSLDEALKSGDLEPAFTIFRRYRDRRLAQLEPIIALLAEEGELPRYGAGAKLGLDRDESPWPVDEAALKELRNKLLASEVVELELAGRDEEEVRDLLAKRYDNRLQRTRQMNSGDIVRLFINSFAQCIDPHTEYYPPKAAEDFDIEMSLSVSGIGAILTNESVYTRIERLIPGGPAEGSGQLEASDRIVAVAQGDDGDFVDVIGYRVDEVAELVRGERGTVVRLNILSAEQAEGSAPRLVRIVREKVKLEERAATSEVITVGEGDEAKRIGVIDLPAFYIDFEARAAGEKDFRSSTRDVGRLVSELVEEGIEGGVDGIVLDLRGNGGGSLDEAVGVAELFIGAKSVVQIRYGSNQVLPMAGKNEAIYDGPFALLVDRLSASASEILAGAIRDHGRGPVVGTRTFGKGTVQVLFPTNKEGAGEIKVTRAQFYRPTGGSTQHRGVEPDIVFPSQYDEGQIGESALEHALPWDEIKAVGDAEPSPVAEYVDELSKRHGVRAMHNPDFDLLAARVALLEELRERSWVSLEIEERRAENDAVEARWLAIENTRRVAKGLDPLESLDAEEDEEDEGEDEKEGEEDSVHDEPDDPIAVEAATVLADYIRLGKH